MKTKKIILTLFLSLLFFTPLLTLQSWDLKKNKNNIQVYTRAVRGSKSKEFRAVTYMRTSLTSLVALLDDTPAFTSWSEGSRKAIILKRENIRVRYTYNITKVPWPIKDRDMVIYSSYRQDPKTKIVTIVLRSSNSLLSPKDDLIRINFLKGFWRFTPLENGLVKVEYQVHADPGGSLPAWMANMFITDSPWKTLNKMRIFVKKAKYQNQNLDQVTELESSSDNDS